MDTYIINNKVYNIDKVKNWGDLIPYMIIKILSRSKNLTRNVVYNIDNQSKHTILSTGSVFHYSHESSIVWGTGCIDKGMIGEAPKKIYSVRGPLTRQSLLDRNIECPEIYGDPALLFPIFYNPDIRKITHKYGFIPHYIEFSDPEARKVIHRLDEMGVKIINICAGEYRFVDELLSVENVFSSSLHGLVAADAYAIPNAKVNLTNKLIGGNFKFEDYFLSVSRENDLGLQLNNNTTLEDIENLPYNKEVKIDFMKLFESGPWHDKENENIFKP
jgi:pyruvyltransferase